jgi:hypothetical protein
MSWRVDLEFRLGAGWGGMWGDCGGAGCRMAVVVEELEMRSGEFLSLVWGELTVTSMAGCEKGFTVRKVSRMSEGRTMEVRGVD